MITSCLKVAAVLLLSVLLFNVPAPTQQVVLTDADKTAILSILFAQEIAASQNEKQLVILSPQSDTRLLVELPGIRFKRLNYGEEQTVTEYFHLGETKIETDFVEVWLRKGNYCKKAGNVYHFRKESGQWKAKIVNGFESFTSAGDICASCRTGSGSEYVLKNKLAQPKEFRPNDLQLTGKARAVRCRRDDTKYIRCEVDLNLDFSNRDDKPIIIVQPYGEYSFWHGASYLALTKTDLKPDTYVYSSEAWPHIYDTEKYRVIAEALDQPTPPAQVTRVLKPGEAWAWTTTIRLALLEENSCSGAVGVEIGWREIKKLREPVWLAVAFEMWPISVEHSKEGLGGKLKERWKQYGNLYLQGQFEGYWFAHLTSEPIELDFQRVQLKHLIK